MASTTGTTRLDLDGDPIRQLRICMIGAGGFIGSHLFEKLMAETPHKVLAVDVYSDKIKNLLQPPPEHGRIQFHRLNIKNDSRLEGLIKMSDLVPPLQLPLPPPPFCRYASPPGRSSTSSSPHLEHGRIQFHRLNIKNGSRLEGLIKISDLVEYCSENSKRLIHFSSCKVYGKAFGSFLPKDHPLRQA